MNYIKGEAFRNSHSWRFGRRYNSSNEIKCVIVAMVTYVNCCGIKCKLLSCYRSDDYSLWRANFCTCPTN